MISNNKEDDKPLSFFQRWQLTNKLNKLQKELDKVLKEDKQSREDQNKKLQEVILDLLSDSGLHIEDDTCTCGTEDCTQKGEDHTKTHIERVEVEDIEKWSVEKKQRVILGFFDELKIYLKENRKNRG